MRSARRVPVTDAVPPHRNGGTTRGVARYTRERLCRPDGQVVVVHSTVAVPSRPTLASARRVPRRVLPAVGVSLLLALLTLVLVIDAVLRPPGAVDLWLLRTVQALPLPYLAVVLWPVDRLTGAVGAITVWSVLLVVLLVARWWLPTLAMLCLPAAGVVDNLFRLFLVDRARPAADQVLRTATGTDHNAFPSGHVLGAVLLYGLLFVFAERLPAAWLRWGVRLLCGWVIATVGFGRLWYGAHWPTDVLAGYAMGGVLLLGLVQCYRWLARVGGVHGAVRLVGEVLPRRATRCRTTGTAIVPVPPLDG